MFPQTLNARDARDAKDAKRGENKTEQENGKIRKTGKKLFGVLTRRLSAFSCVPGSLVFLLVLGSVATVAAFALKWIEGFPYRGKIFSTLWWHRQKPGIRFVPFFMRQGVWALALGVVAGDEEVL